MIFLFWKLCRSRPCEDVVQEVQAWCVVALCNVNIEDQTHRTEVKSTDEFVAGSNW